MNNKEIKEYDIKEFDKNNNLIYYKDSFSHEVWKKYDENSNQIYFKNSFGYEQWKEYDENNNRIHYKDSNGYELWYKRDENNIPIEITQQEFKQIERTKLYLNIKRSNRFEIMDI